MRLPASAVAPFALIVSLGGCVADGGAWNPSIQAAEGQDTKGQAAEDQDTKGQAAEGSRIIPADVPPVYGTFASIATGAHADHTLAIVDDGAACGGGPYAWGDNDAYQLGDGTSVGSPTAKKVDPSGALQGKTITALAAGGLFSLALASDNTVFAWGLGVGGRYGDIHDPVKQPAAIETIDTTALHGKTITAISAGGNHSVLLTSDGLIYCWGDNDWGQLGDGYGGYGTSIGDASRSIPAPVDTTGAMAGKTIRAISAGAFHTLALATDGAIYAWGVNDAGQLGDGTTASRSRPVAVDMTGALKDKTIIAISAGGYHSLALASDGTVFTWGSTIRTFDEDDVDPPVRTPVEIDAGGAMAGKTIKAISAGFGHSLALAWDDTIYTWGDNVSAQLSDDEATLRTTPVQVDTSGALAGKSIKTIAAGTWFSVALAYDGTVYRWKEAWNDVKAPVPVAVPPPIL